MNKIILSLIIAGVLVVGTITTATMVDAQRPPELDPDEDGLLEGVVWEIIGMLKHPDWGLEIIDDEVEHIHDELHHADWGLPVIDDEVEHNHDELHDSDWGLPVIDDEVEYNTALLEDPGFGLEEIKHEVRGIEGNVTSTDFGLEEIHNDVHGSNIELFKVHVDLRTNFFEITPNGCDVNETPKNATCALIPENNPYNMWGIQATCPTDDPNCGVMTFTSIKALEGYSIDNSYGDEIDINFAMSAIPIIGLIIDDSYAIITGPVGPATSGSFAFVGIGNNNLYNLGTGTVYGQSVYVHGSPSQYFGVAEFIIYAPTGTTFKQIWQCDGIFSSCSRVLVDAIVDDTPPNNNIDWTDTT